MLTETDSDKLAGLSYRELWKIDPKEVESFRLMLLQKRFRDLRSNVSTLDKLAELQGVSTIEQLDDVIPILFQHQTYKSYPMSLLEKGKFDALTKWLAKLTTHDLSGVDASRCKSVDEWLQKLDDETPLKVVHSSGTTGKLSLIPRDEKDIRRFTITSIRRFEGFGDEPDRATPLLQQKSKKMPVIYPSYRYGRYAGNRLFLDTVDLFGSPEDSYVLHETLMSADVISLAGRVAGAEARGELDKLDIPDALIQKYKETMALNASRAETEKVFLDRLIANCEGRDAIIFGPGPMMVDWARMLRERGIEQLFGQNSLIQSGGGDKGITLPDNWQDDCARYIGARPTTSYGMSECCTQYPVCPEGNFHSTPNVIPFVLDPETGEALPREGKQTGRYAFFDLLPDTYWGGFITGDRITAHWDGCPCGRRGFYVEPTIVRFQSISEDGDDKINCAGAANAHERALDFLNSLAKTA